MPRRKSCKPVLPAVWRKIVCKRCRCRFELPEADELIAKLHTYCYPCLEEVREEKRKRARSLRGGSDSEA